MFKNQLQIKLAFLVIAGLILSPFAEAAFRTSKTGKGKYDGSSVSTITSSCLTNGFPSDTAGATLCQEVTAGTYDTDCVNWGLDQSPVVSISACSGLTHTQYTNFKTAYGQATLGITSGGNGFTSYTEQKSYFDTYLTNTKAIYANQLGYSASASHNTTYEAAASAVTSLQSQCSSSTTSPLTTCSASISNCACIPKSEYDDIASGAVAVAAALDAADNTPHTLTKALIDNIVGLDTSSIDLTDSNVIDYLAGQFASLDSTTTTQPSQLTSYVVGATATNVALWKIGKMVSDSTNHPSTGLSESLIDNAVGNSFSTSDALALDSTKTISTLRTALSGSGLGSSPTASAVQGWVGTHVGFASATSFTAYLANTDNANYTLAQWGNCYSSADTVTGGTGNCSITSTQWQSLSALASASSASDISDSDLTNIISASNVEDSDDSFGDLASLTSVENDYLRDCMGTSVTSSSLVSCVTGATPTTVPVYNIAKKVAGDYSGTISISDVTNAGISSIDTATGAQNMLTFLNSNTCGSDGSSACSEVLSNVCGSGNNESCGDDSVISAGSSATQAEVLSYLKSAALAYTQKQVAAATITSASGQRCADISIPAPHPCGKSNTLYTCTGLSGWTYNDSNNSTGTLTKADAPISGNLSAQIRVRREAWWGGSTYDKNITVNVALSSAASGDVTQTWTTQNYGRSSINCREAQKQCTAAGGDILPWNDLPASQRNAGNASDNYWYPDSIVTSGYSRWGTFYSNGVSTATDWDLQSNGRNPGNQDPNDCNVVCRSSASCS